MTYRSSWQPSVLLRPSHRTPLLRESTKSTAPPLALALLPLLVRHSPCCLCLCVTQYRIRIQNRRSQRGRRARARPQEAPSMFFNQPPPLSLHFTSNPRPLTLQPTGSLTRSSDPAYTFGANFPHWSLFSLTILGDTCSSR